MSLSLYLLLFPSSRPRRQIMNLSLYSLAPRNLPIRGQSHSAVGRAGRRRNEEGPSRMLEGRRAGCRLGRGIKINSAPAATGTWREEGFLELTNGWTNRLKSAFGVELRDEALGHLMGGRQADLRAYPLATDGGTKNRRSRAPPRVASRSLRVEGLARRHGRSPAAVRRSRRPSGCRPRKCGGARTVWRHRPWRVDVHTGMGRPGTHG